MNGLEAFKQALLALDQRQAELCLESITGLSSPLDKIEHIVVPALDQIGSEWIDGKVALSQLYMSGRICEQIIDAALPNTSPDRKDQPAMAIVTLCDYHILGKRIVFSMLRAAGYELKDYGTMNVDDLVHAVLQDQIKILLISTLMLPSALRVKDLREALEQRGKSITLIVGGAPFRFDPTLYRKVGADHMCAQASEVIGLINVLSSKAAA